MPAAPATRTRYALMLAESRVYLFRIRRRRGYRSPVFTSASGDAMTWATPESALRNASFLGEPAFAVPVERPR
jgi:DNA-binding IclR family transcriptional regulator